MRRGLVGAVLVSLLLVVYLVAVAGRALDLLRTGEPVGVVLGAGVLVLPVLGALLLAREWQLAVVVQRMADRLAAEGALPADDLPRTPSGRVVRSAADAAFPDAARRVEETPDDWRAWFELGFAYDAAGDRRRARAALRRAARLFRERPDR